MTPSKEPEDSAVPKDNHSAPEPSTNTANSETDSLPSRILSSASSLAHASISSVSTSTFNLSYSTSLSNNPKAGPSQLGEGARYQDGPAADHFAGAGSASSASYSNNRNGTTFRTETNAAQAAMQVGDLDAFMNSDSHLQVDQNAALNDVVLSHSDSKGKGKARGDSADGNTTTLDTAWLKARANSQPPLIFTPHPQDGAEVSALLSDPSFQPDLFPSEEDINNAEGADWNLQSNQDPTSNQFIYDTQLSPEDADLARRFNEVVLRAIPDHISSTNPISPNALIPDAETYLPHLGAGSSSASTASRVEKLGAQVPDLRPWLDMLDTYNDEVWGFKEIGTLIREVKKEIEQDASQGMIDGNEEGPALRRLRMILGQIGR